MKIWEQQVLRLPTPSNLTGKTMMKTLGEIELMDMILREVAIRSLKKGLAKIDVERLMEMLPPAGMGMKMEPIQLCGACYGESPCHRIEWQLKSVDRCQEHQLRSLSECPKCGARFKVPALWVDG